MARRIAAAGVGAASAAAAGGAGGEGSSGPEPRVFFGTKRSMPVRQKSRTLTQRAMGLPGPSMVEVEPDYPKRPTERDDVRGLSQALGQFYQWSDEERAKWGRYLVDIGFIHEDDASDYTTLLKAWQEVVEEGANFTAAGKKADPWQVARILAGTDNDPGNPGGGRTRAGRERGFTGARSTTSQAVDLTDPETARALVRNVLTQQYGRDATSEEVQSFTSTLNAAERANPLNTTTTTQFVDGEATGQSSTTSGGLTAAAKQQTVTDQAQALPEYGAYQAASFYFPLLSQALSAPV